MKKTTLIAPYDDPLALAIAGEAHILGRATAAFLPGSEVKKTAPAEAPEDLPIAWNPPSYVSARASVLEAVVRYGALDEAALIASPGIAPGLSAKPAELEKLFQDRVLSFFWLTREILARFSERGTGRLVFVLADRGQSQREPAAAAVFGAIVSFASSLAETSQDAPYNIWAVQDSCPQDDLAAQYISKILSAPDDRRGGRVIKYTGKSSIFNRI